MPEAKNGKKQKDLPTMEDREIRPLEDAAEEYAEVRDKRMELNKEEAHLKDKLHKLMNKHEIKSYHRDGIDIKIVVENETVKVKIKKEKDGD